jgi:uncharacterized membrane protein
MLWFVGICFGIYVLSRLSNLYAELEVVKRQLAYLDSARLPAWQQPNPPGVDPNPGLKTPDAPPMADFVVDFPFNPAVPPIISAPQPARTAYAAPPMPPSPVRPQPEPNAPFDIESVVGANWMAKLGVAAIAVSVAFFLQYAFRNGWITPWGQVSIGLCGSVAMMGAGQFLLGRERFKKYAQVLFSGGIVVYFLSIYAAYSFYQPALIGYWPAFGALAIGALAASALALANGTEVVAIICIIGAFAAPALIRDTVGPPSQDGLTRLYASLVGINIWAAAFVRYREWHSVGIVSFMCTWILFLMGGPIERGGWRTEAFAMLFLLSAVLAGVQAICSQAEDNSTELDSVHRAGIAVIVAACLVFALSSRSILSGLSTFGFPDLALVGTLMGLMIAGISLTLPNAKRGGLNIRQRLAGLSAVAAGALMLMAFADAPAIPPNQVPAAFGFAVLNFALFFGLALAIRDQEDGEQPAALSLAINAGVHALIVLHTLAQTKIAGVPAATLWLPIAGWLSLCGIRLTTEEKKNRPLVPAILAITAQLFPLVALLSATSGSELNLVPHWPPMAACIIAAEFALVSATWLGLRKRLILPEVRLDVIGAIGTGAVFFGLMAWGLGVQKANGLSLLAVCAAAMAAWHALAALILQASDAEDRLLRDTYLGLAVSFLTIAIPLQLELAWVTVAWAVEAAMLVWAGCRAGSFPARAFGYTVLTIAASRAFTIDLPRTPEPFTFLMNERMLAGFAVIAAAYVSAWQVSRLGESRSAEEANVCVGLCAAANLLTLAFVSADLWRFYGGQESGMVSAQQLALSIFWALYGFVAVCVGIWARQRTVRLFAMGLLYVAIFKVFLYDLGELETPYRVASFFTLGLVFLVVSYLYTRFEERMRDSRGSVPPEPGFSGPAAHTGGLSPS